MAGVDAHRPPAALEDGVVGRHEHAVVAAFQAHQAVGLVDRVQGEGDGGSNAPDQTAGHGHEQRRADAFVGHIGDDHAQPVARQREGVVEVAGHLPHAVPGRRDLVAGELRQALGEHAALDLVGHAQFAFQAGALHLQAVQAGILQGDPGDCGEGGQQV